MIMADVAPQTTSLIGAMICRIYRPLGFFLSMAVACMHMIKSKDHLAYNEIKIKEAADGPQARSMRRGANG